MPDIIFKKILKTMKRTIGKTRLKPSPANMLLTIPAIYLGFENNYENEYHEQSEKNCKRNSELLTEKIN